MKKSFTLINEAEQQEVKASDLKATLIGKALMSIRKANGDNKIGKASTKLLDKWRAQVKREIIQEEQELEIVEQENAVIVKEEQPKLFRTYFKFIGKVDSTTNDFYKTSVLAHFT